MLELRKKKDPCICSSIRHSENAFLKQQEMKTTCKIIKTMNSKRFLYHIKRQGNKVATFLKSRDVVTFLFFFLLAFFMWYMYSIGTQREIKRKIPMQYTGIPEDVKLTNPLPER